MKYISIIMCLSILAVWLLAGALELGTITKRRGWRKILPLLAAMLVVIGALGFFGSGLAAMGALDWLPPSFEWPVGYASGVVATKDGWWVVPHTSSSRVQIYDSHWKFLRGWHVDAGSGIFKLYVTDTNHINVVTARLEMHYVYDLDGRLLSSEKYPATGTGYSSFPTEGVRCVVPTPVWLWAFTSPFYSWVVAVAGLLCMGLQDKVSKQKSHSTRVLPQPPGESSGRGGG